MICFTLVPYLFACFFIALFRAYLSMLVSTITRNLVIIGTRQVLTCRLFQCSPSYTNSSNVKIITN